MKSEDKELLLKDLSARLPYHVKCKVWLKYGTTEEGLLDLEHNYGDVLQDAFFYTDRIKDIKPYLRPMSSMTKEEYNEVGDLLKAEDPSLNLDEVMATIEIDWLNSHHFDYRGLIDKGLAIAVTEENNPYKD